MIFSVRRGLVLSVLLLALAALGATGALAANLTDVDAAARCQALQGGRWTTLPSAPTPIP